MIGTTNWPFTFSKRAEQPGTRIIGQYGIARNRGSTPEALQEIIRKFRLVSETGFFLELQFDNYDTSGLK
jgi:hypothetical protein